MNWSDEWQSKVTPTMGTHNYCKANGYTVAQKKATARYQNTWPGRAARTFNSIRIRARNNNLDFDLDREWIVDRIRGKCELTGLSFKHVKARVGKGKPGPKPFSPSVDRIDPLKGYTKDNCRVILFCVNIFKQTLSDKQLQTVAESLVAGLMRLK